MHSSKSNRTEIPATSVNKSNSFSSTLPDSHSATGPRAGSALPKLEVSFAELRKGTFVEMIEDPDNAANSLFAVYSNGVVRYVPEIEYGNRILTPFPREAGILKHVRFPRGGRPSASPEDILTSIGALIRGCVDVNGNDAILIAAFVMSTWFIESLPIAPYLALVGLPHSGKTTLLQVLNLVWRRSLLTADITSAAFYEVYRKLDPTLLVD
jgi:hypothetical protein